MSWLTKTLTFMVLAAQVFIIAPQTTEAYDYSQELSHLLTGSLKEYRYIIEGNSYMGINKNNFELKSLSQKEGNQLRNDSKLFVDFDLKEFDTIFDEDETFRVKSGLGFTSFTNYDTETMEIEINNFDINVDTQNPDVRELFDNINHGIIRILNRKVQIEANNISQFLETYLDVTDIDTDEIQEIVSISDLNKTIQQQRAFIKNILMSGIFNVEKSYNKYTLTLTSDVRNIRMYYLRQAFTALELDFDSIISEADFRWSRFRNREEINQTLQKIRSAVNFEINIYSENKRLKSTDLSLQIGKKAYGSLLGIDENSIDSLGLPSIIIRSNNKYQYGNFDVSPSIAPLITQYEMFPSGISEDKAYEIYSTQSEIAYEAQKNFHSHWYHVYMDNLNQRHINTPLHDPNQILNINDLSVMLRSGAKARNFNIPSSIEELLFYLKKRQQETQQNVKRVDAIRATVNTFFPYEENTVQFAIQHAIVGEDMQHIDQHNAPVSYAEFLKILDNTLTLSEKMRL